MEKENEKAKENYLYWNKSNSYDYKGKVIYIKPSVYLLD